MAPRWFHTVITEIQGTQSSYQISTGLQSRTALVARWWCWMLFTSSSLRTLLCPFLIQFTLLLLSLIYFLLLLFFQQFIHKLIRFFSLFVPIMYFRLYFLRNCVHHYIIWLFRIIMSLSLSSFQYCHCWLWRFNTPKRSFSISLSPLLSYCDTINIKENNKTTKNMIHKLPHTVCFRFSLWFMILM